MSPSVCFSLIIMLPQSSITVSTGLTETPKQLDMQQLVAQQEWVTSYIFQTPQVNSFSSFITCCFLSVYEYLGGRAASQSVSHRLRRATQTHTNFVWVYLQVKHFITHLSGFLQLFVHGFSLFHFSLNSFSSRSLFAVFQFISVKPWLPAKLRDGVWGDETGAQSCSGYRPWRGGMMKKITSQYGFWTI